MPLPSPDQFLAKLASDPAAAAAFDRATQRDTPGKSRKDAVHACHRLATTTLAEIAANKAKLIAARQKIAALEAARITNSRLRSSLATTRAKLAVLAKASPPNPACRFAGASDALVKQAATHRSSPAADRIEARAELEKRGFTVTAEGILSRSIRGGRAFKQSLKS